MRPLRHGAVTRPSRVARPVCLTTTRRRERERAYVRRPGMCLWERSSRRTGARAATCPSHVAIASDAPAPRADQGHHARCRAPGRRVVQASVAAPIAQRCHDGRTSVVDVGTGGVVQNPGSAARTARPLWARYRRQASMRRSGVRGLSVHGARGKGGWVRGRRASPRISCRRMASWAGP
ncbi:hypothetical protein GGS23DRAFT_562991 [Durotheca rogersii]|uniref:uncharacterized protein n=1 Tax=Durotheca rogersii TaxID=419775 RepID=UPI00221F8705|nr:uncharacterized protein GGS23DRAFT_562991 [Durotheca rogersii]KAI5864112.1 hypothetical protein GGS23DRAFT_562991 [Durotheca rogersii]